MVGPSLPTTNKLTIIKFLCSYGGKILPRHPDGKLRYHGGETRVLAVDRSICFSELLLKLGELCGKQVSLRCQLPTEDLDALVSITSDEDLANLIEEYDRVASPPSSLKIRAFLSLPKSKPSSKKPPLSPPSSSSSSSSSSSPSSSPKSSSNDSTRLSRPATGRCHHHRMSVAPASTAALPEKSAGKMINNIPLHGYYAHGNPRHIYLIDNGNYWQ
ncbi:hypothetical protein LWI28_018103 [Acer negundo]|uniref:PB1 domain-containing protein n=1 Tax=Acer negundo TaxID=4023 RepID=A0AAD5NMW0_ACENE|nr:hypothetical protein LWI28_018103 [Acer negundo]KAK4842463.1 hypothetical protein QYF36_022094 [Acer negundo]